ncbi:hypothetical protein [Streptomyces sp. NBRC 110611]|uniref:hypothetical protein n=1 Tax=Streptomyces sp. NBRC 110611 TaxID=1621259 RepID=UPI00082BEDD7|nr:hypothetical protein [Streptomyces sp. NBRC 110611]
MGIDDTELTPFERELQEADASEGRGHTPDDGIAEPTVAPTGPAGVSAAPGHDPLPAPPGSPEAPGEE